MRMAMAFAAATACCIAAEAGAQNGSDPRLPAPAPREAERGDRTHSDLSVRADRSRRSSGNDMLALSPPGNDIAIGIGRFSVLDPPRPRSHMEADRDPTNVRRAERSIGGIGLRITF